MLEQQGDWKTCKVLGHEWGPAQVTDWEQNADPIGADMIASEMAECARCHERIAWHEVPSEKKPRP